MKRKIYEKLVEWKQKESRYSALVIDGARRVGKSYIAREFGETEYRSFIIVDFNRVGQEVKNLFTDYLNDLDSLFMYLSSYYNTKLYPHESLIVFDEIQLFPPARSAIKYLVEDGRFDYLETGSLMSIKMNVKDILIPSEEKHLKMYPMDFEEFLWALGDTTMMDFIRACYEKTVPLGQSMHRKAMNYFRQYLIVGGMPQAVNEYVNSRDFAMVDRIKRNILDLYRNDIVKYAIGYQAKVGAIFDDIPSQLQKHEKRFKFSSLSKSARFRGYKDALFWLNDSMIANLCYNATEPKVGLRLNTDRLALKCYLADTGLLISHSFDENGIVSADIYKKILFDRLEINEGMLIENIVAQMLVASDHKLYYFSKASKEDKDNRMEIDFLIAKTKVGSRHNITPIEVKSSTNYTFTSLRKFQKKYAEQCYKPTIIHPADFKVQDGIMYLPLYMTPLL